ncbi:hypothetical protein BDK51DRAFT_41378 [Blyttiomyces helicus]|uniref:C2H2-type domain-containing protein n=1 Tax=Blyttiomyces helicus TaxID=388810 RepID=A0A4P9WFD5_9FUNG|nr:hypothetical protein BDK51DRAFT_41378 [Blyttiomyces helicus]|eukprot:RKO91451.1 hypothetical protein BDK51DRAFT_41378 [Blyttiomyces helicus]
MSARIGPFSQAIFSDSCPIRVHRHWSCLAQLYPVTPAAAATRATSISAIADSAPITELRSQYGRQLVPSRHAPVVQNGVWTCVQDGCNETFATQLSYKSHIRCHAVRTYTCPMCPAKFSRSHDLRRHERSLHEAGKPHDCPEFGRCFARADAVSALPLLLLCDEILSPTHSIESVASPSPSRKGSSSTGSQPPPLPAPPRGSCFSTRGLTRIPSTLLSTSSIPLRSSSPGVPKILTFPKQTASLRTPARPLGQTHPSQPTRIRGRSDDRACPEVTPIVDQRKERQTIFGRRSSPSVIESSSDSSVLSRRPGEPSNVDPLANAERSVRQDTCYAFICGEFDHFFSVSTRAREALVICTFYGTPFLRSDPSEHKGGDVRCCHGKTPTCRNSDINASGCRGRVTTEPKYLTNPYAAGFEPHRLSREPSLAREHEEKAPITAPPFANCSNGNEAEAEGLSAGAVQTWTSLVDTRDEANEAQSDAVVEHDPGVFIKGKIRAIPAERTGSLEPVEASHQSLLDWKLAVRKTPDLCLRVDSLRTSSMKLGFASMCWVPTVMRSGLKAR